MINVIGTIFVFLSIVHLTTKVGTTGYVTQIVMVKSACLLFMFLSIRLNHYRNQNIYQRVP